MPRQARSKPKPTQPEKQPATVIDERLYSHLGKASSKLPVRTVVYIEVGDAPPDHVREAINSISAIYRSAHPTFVIPVRHGKLSTDVFFEAEVLEFINQICEIQNGTIVLRNGCTGIEVLRKRL